MILSEMDINTISDPIKIPGGFLILKINDIREVENKLDINEELDFAIKSKTNKQLDQFSNIYFNKISKNLIINES